MKSCQEQCNRQTPAGGPALALHSSMPGKYDKEETLKKGDTYDIWVGSSPSFLYRCPDICCHSPPPDSPWLLFRCPCSTAPLHSKRENNRPMNSSRSTFHCLLKIFGSKLVHHRACKTYLGKGSKKESRFGQNPSSPITHRNSLSLVSNRRSFHRPPYPCQPRTEPHSRPQC